MKLTALSTFDIGIGGVGLEYKDGFLYLNSSGVIKKINPDTGIIVASYGSSMGSGLCWDGQYWWTTSGPVVHGNYGTSRYNSDFTINQSYDSGGPTVIGATFDYAYDQIRDVIHSCWDWNGTVVSFDRNHNDVTVLDTYVLSVNFDSDHGITWVGEDEGYILRVQDFGVHSVIFKYDSSGAYLDKDSNNSGIGSRGCRAIAWKTDETAQTIIYTVLGTTLTKWLVEHREPATDGSDWRGRKQAPTAKGWHATKIADNKLIMTGGKTVDKIDYAIQTDVSNQTQVFDLSTYTWSYGANMPGERWYHTAVGAGSDYYVFGGIETSTGNLQSTVWRYNASTNIWTSGLASIPDDSTSTNAVTYSGISRATAVWDGGSYIYLHGGYRQNGGNIIASAKLYRYDIDNDSWTELTSAPSGRYDAGGVYNNGILYFCGGVNVNNIAIYTSAGSNVAIYNTATDSWSTATFVDTNVNFRPTFINQYNYIYSYSIHWKLNIINNGLVQIGSSISAGNDNSYFDIGFDGDIDDNGVMWLIYREPFVIDRSFGNFWLEQIGVPKFLADSTVTKSWSVGAIDI